MLFQKKTVKIAPKTKRVEIKPRCPTLKKSPISWKKPKGRCEFCPEHPEKILNQHHMERHHFMGRYPCPICRYDAQGPYSIEQFE